MSLEVSNLEASSFLAFLGFSNDIQCNLTTGFICTDTLIILDSPLCEGVFGSENQVYQKNQTAEMDFLGTVRIV